MHLSYSDTITVKKQFFVTWLAPKSGEAYKTAFVEKKAGQFVGFIYEFLKKWAHQWLHRAWSCDCTNHSGSL